MSLRYLSWPWVAGVLALLSLVLHGPLLPQFSSAVPSDLGDPLLNTWILWWNAQRLPLTEAYWNAPAFAPSAHAFALSETLLGLTWLTTPLQWLGASPLVAYNVMFVIEPVLNGLSAYWLCLTLTGRRDAAFVGGFAFAFAPYHAMQLAHVQNRAMFFMPIALAALHRYWKGGQRRWLAVFAFSLAMNGLVSGYFLLFFGMLVSLVIGWLAIAFPDRRKLVAVLVAIGVAALMVWPVMSTYRVVQRDLQLRRTVTEIESLSADLRSIVLSSPNLVLWPVKTAVHRSELAGYPGLAITGLVVVGAFIAVRGRERDRAAGRFRVVAARILATFSVAGLGAGVILFLMRRLSYKVFGIAIDLGLLAVLLSTRFTILVRSGSLMALYATGAVAAWLLALGPVGRLSGHRFWYKAPYSWLIQLPGFDAVRAPVRFLSIEVLCLAVIAALVFARVWPVPKRSSVIGALAIAGAIVIDGWMRLPIVTAPRALPVAVSADLVVELPTRGYEEDVAAMYRGMSHGRPVVNGYSGWLPPHYVQIQADLRRDCVRSLEGLRGGRSIDAVIWRGQSSVVLDAGLRELWSNATREETPEVIVYRQPRSAVTTDPGKMTCLSARVDKP